MDAETIRYFDGVSFQAQTALIRISTTGIILSTQQETIEWPFHQLILIEKPHRNNPCVIAYQLTQGARVVISQPDIYNQILPNIAQHKMRHSHVSHPWRVLFIVLLIAVILFATALWSIPYIASPIAKLIPHSWDQSLGHFVSNQITASYKQCIDPKGTQVLEKLANRLTQSQQIAHPLHISVVDMEDINAFAVPGFQIVIMKGLIDMAESPNEVAGVLAHEIGHAIEHHPTAGLITQLGFQIIISAATGYFPELGKTLIQLSYSRQKEYEADLIAVNLLNAANISAKGLEDFFANLQKMIGDNRPFSNYLSTHPNTQERMARVAKANKIQQNQPVLSSVEWASLRNICRQKEGIRNTK